MACRARSARVGIERGRWVPCFLGMSRRCSGRGRSPRQGPRRSLAVACFSGVSQSAWSPPGVFGPVFAVTRLTARARGKRVHPQRAQALARAPSPGRHGLDDPPLQGPDLTMPRCPGARGPARCRQARGRVECHGLPLRNCAPVDGLLRLPPPVPPAGRQPPCSVGSSVCPSPPSSRVACAASRVPDRLHRLLCVRVGASWGLRLALPWRAHPASHVARGSPTRRGRRPLDTERVHGGVSVPFTRPALPSLPFGRWGRRVALAPPASRCVTPRLQVPYPYRLFPDGHTMCHSQCCAFPRA
jgi:hypothetical protein